MHEPDHDGLIHGEVIVSASLFFFEEYSRCSAFCIIVGSKVCTKGYKSKWKKKLKLKDINYRTINYSPFVLVLNAYHEGLV